jgi:hypothetical protein
MKSEKGEISKSMGVDTRPAHKFEVNGYWVMVDPKMPIEQFKAMLHTFSCLGAARNVNEPIKSNKNE